MRATDWKETADWSELLVCAYWWGTTSYHETRSQRRWTQCAHSTVFSLMPCRNPNGRNRWISVQISLLYLSRNRLLNWMSVLIVHALNLQRRGISVEVSSILQCFFNGFFLIQHEGLRPEGVLFCTDFKAPGGKFAICDIRLYKHKEVTQWWTPRDRLHSLQLYRAF